jgi:hypothetical protein
MLLLVFNLFPLEMIPLYCASFFGYAEIFEFHAMEKKHCYFLLYFLPNNYIII